MEIRADRRSRTARSTMQDRSVHIFDIYEHPEQGLRAVRRGFSWAAFLLPSVWAVRRELGWTTLALFVLTTTAFDLARMSAESAHPIVQMGLLAGLLALVGLKPGLEGYRWQARVLEQKGFAHVRTVAAASPRVALDATIHNRFEGAPIPVAAG
jgi:hypothetical protein